MPICRLEQAKGLPTKDAEENRVTWFAFESSGPTFSSIREREEPAQEST